MGKSITQTPIFERMKNQRPPPGISDKHYELFRRRLFRAYSEEAAVPSGRWTRAQLPRHDSGVLEELLRLLEPIIGETVDLFVSLAGSGKHGTARAERVVRDCLLRAIWATTGDVRELGTAGQPQFRLKATRALARHPRADDLASMTLGEALEASGASLTDHMVFRFRWLLGKDLWDPHGGPLAHLPSGERFRSIWSSARRDDGVAVIAPALDLHDAQQLDKALRPGKGRLPIEFFEVADCLLWQLRGGLVPGLGAIDPEIGRDIRELVLSMLSPLASRRFRTISRIRRERSKTRLTPLTEAQVAGYLQHVIEQMHDAYDPFRGRGRRPTSIAAGLPLAATRSTWARSGELANVERSISPSAYVFRHSVRMAVDVATEGTGGRLSREAEAEAEEDDSEADGSVRRRRRRPPPGASPTRLPDGRPGLQPRQMAELLGTSAGTLVARDWQGDEPKPGGIQAVRDADKTGRRSVRLYPNDGGFIMLSRYLLHPRELATLVGVSAVHLRRFLNSNEPISKYPALRAVTGLVERVRELRRTGLRADADLSWFSPIVDALRKRDPKRLSLPRRKPRSPRLEPPDPGKLPFKKLVEHVADWAHRIDRAEDRIERRVGTLKTGSVWFSLGADLLRSAERPDEDGLRAYLERVEVSALRKLLRVARLGRRRGRGLPEPTTDDQLEKWELIEELLAPRLLRRYLRRGLSRAEDLARRRRSSTRDPRGT